MHTNYKREIDGLRAIAVLAVVGYHVGLGPPAGFIGVDIFFVISGYLITGMLQQEATSTQRIDLLDFYARRARRILPALLAVTLATLGASAVLLLATELKQVMQAAAAAFAFSANLFFATAANGYFDPETHANPLLHLWSIGVEEQFYIVWPLVVLLARRRAALVYGLIALASFTGAQWLLGQGDERWAFYQMPLRAWELAAGGLITVSRIPVRRWVAPLGLLVVLSACAVPLAPFPGTGALPAVLGTCLVIASIHAGQRNAVLGARPAVALGRASYSLYLWHWPIIVLGEALPGWLQLVVAVLAAVASYRLIEQPFRRRWVFPAKATLSAAGVTLALLCAGGALTASQLADGTKTAKQVAELRDRLTPIYKMGCDDWYQSARLNPCTFGSPNARHTVLLAGDSVVMQWFPAVRKAFNRPGWRLVVLTKSSCAMVDAAIYYKRAGGVYTNCAIWRTGVEHWVAANRPDVVITGLASDYAFSSTEWLAGTRVTMSRMAAHSGQLVLLRSTPLLSPAGNSAFDDVHRLETEALSGIGNASIIDMNPTICPLGPCNTRAYRDRRHLTPEFTASIARDFAARISTSPP